MSIESKLNYLEAIQILLANRCELIDINLRISKLERKFKYGYKEMVSK